MPTAGPSDDVLSEISERRCFKDWHSEDERGNINDKYKLAAKQKIAGTYHFFVPTSQNYRANIPAVLCIEQSEWEDRRSGMLGESKSYIDLANIDVHSADDLIAKIKNPTNGFPYAATLSEARFADLQNKLNEIGRRWTEVTAIKRSVIAGMLLDDGDPSTDEIKKRLSIR